MKRIIVTLILLLPLSLKAQLYIEPYYMTEMSSEFDEDNNPVGTERPGGEVKNFVYGGRIYFNFNKDFLAGADYSISKSRFTINSNEALVNQLNAAGTNLEDRFDGTHFGVIAGKEYNNAYTWVGAGVSELVDDNGNSRTGIGSEYSGTYWLVGAGYHLFGTIKLSIEYRRHKYDAILNPNTGVKTDLPSNSVGRGELDVKEILFGISIPLILGKKGK